MSDAAPLKQTQFGFRWGPVEVQRFLDDKRGVLIGLLTDRGCVQVWVTPSGFVRVAKMNKSHRRSK